MTDSRIFRCCLLTGAAIFGLLVAARAIFGPLSFPVRVHTPINIESFCGLFLMLLLAIRMGRDRPGVAERRPVSMASTAAVVLLVAVAFWRAIHVYFLADDFILVQRANAFHFKDIGRLLTTVEGSAFFRPLFSLSLAITATWAKLDPRLWHAASLGLHALNSVLVLVLAARLGLSRGGAFFAGALFAIHGALPESVVWVAAESGLIPTFFVLCALLAFLAYLQGTSRSRWWYGAASVVCMVLALLAKESAYVFPLVASLFALSERIPLRRCAGLLLLFLGVAVCLFVYRWMLIGGIGGYLDLKSGARLTAEVGVVQALRGLLLRVWAVLFFPINWSRQPGLLLGVATAGYVASLLWMAWWIPQGRAKRLPLLFPLGFLCLASLPPVQQLLIAADLQKSRALYLASAGFALMLATATEPLGRRARWIVPAVVLIFHFAALQHNLTAWQLTGEAAKRTCTSVSQCAWPKPAKVEVWNMPGSLDGVYFLGVGFNECVQMQTGTSLPQAEFHDGDPAGIHEDTELLVWDKLNTDLRCIREGPK